MDNNLFQLNTVEKTALGLLQSGGFEAFIVGGGVRDRAMGIAPKDTDITTSATPNEVKKVFSAYKTVDTGIVHGTVTVIIGGVPLEITTYRSDGEYSDCRHPDSVSFTRSLREDLCRRDFTVNAMAYNQTAGLIDLFGGEKDIKNKVIRCVGDAKTRFEEDALRILRAARFCAALQFEIEDNTAKAMENCAHLLSFVSAERKFAELKKLLCGKWAGKVIMRFPKVFDALLPDLTPCRGFVQNTPYHKFDLLEHTAKTVDNAPFVVHIRLAALLHDIAKPECCTRGDNGTCHFKGHAKISAQKAKEILKAFKCDNFTLNRAVLLISRHSDRITADRAAVGNLIRLLGKDAFFELADLKIADNLSKGTPYGELAAAELKEVKRFARKFIESGAVFTVAELDISGNDLMDIGFTGKAVGKTLDSLLCAVICGKVENEKQALVQFALNGENNG